MKFLVLNFILFLFDIAPNKPQLVGSTNIGIIIGIGLLLSAAAVGAFFLFRKNLPLALRAGLMTILLLMTVGCFSLAALALYEDSQVEIKYRETLRRDSEARIRRNEDRMRRQRESEINANSQTSSNPR